MKACPFCAEEIQDAAIKCKHCGSMLGEPAGVQQEASHDPSARVMSEPAASSESYAFTHCPNCGHDSYVFCVKCRQANALSVGPQGATCSCGGSIDRIVCPHCRAQIGPDGFSAQTEDTSVRQQAISHNPAAVPGATVPGGATGALIGLLLGALVGVSLAFFSTFVVALLQDGAEQEWISNLKYGLIGGAILGTLLGVTGKIPLRLLNSES